MRLKFKPTSVIKARLNIEPGGKVQKFLTHTCKLHMDAYTPFREGDLAYNHVEEGVDYIHYYSPYAHYMYEGKVMGPTFPIFRNGILIGFRSPKGKPKHYTGKDITYIKSAGHEYAGPHWDQRMWTAEKDQVLKEVQDYMNRGAK